MFEVIVVRKFPTVSFVITILFLILCGCQGKRSSVSIQNTEPDTSMVYDGVEMLDTAMSVATQFILDGICNVDEQKGIDKYRVQYSKNPLRLQYYEVCLKEDSVDNMLRRESRVVIVEEDDYEHTSIYFTMSLEKEFCNEMVFRSMERIIDTIFIGLCDYWENKETLSRICKNNMPQNVEGIFGFVEKVAVYINNDKQCMSMVRDYYIPASVSMVCRKVYETLDEITYGLYSLTNYYGSCGNPTQIRYYTVDKSSGHVLSTQDLMKKYQKEQLNHKLLEQYKRVGWNINEYTENFDYVSGADGCATVKDGIVFYYFPYNLGCGNEGQYNLVIRP